MKKGLLTILAVLPCLMAFKCGGDSFESPNNYTPYELLTKNDYAADIFYQNNQTIDNEGVFRQEILKIEKYKNIKELKTTTESCFKYNVRTNGIGFFIDMGADITFYADGYVDVDIPDGYSSLKDHYYYSFDQDEAVTLFEFVFNYFEAMVYQGE